MVFVDLHCHLDWESFDEDREEIISEMKEKGIIALTNTVSYKNYIQTKKMFDRYDSVKVCPGLYPQEAESISDTDFEKYLKYIEDHKDEIVAIGEVGLDRHSTNEEDLLELQEQRFRKIIELAIKINKPVIIHSRKMEQKVLQILREYVEKFGFKKFNLHCFSGKKKLIDDIKELGIYCSIPLTIMNTESFQILVKELPIKQILVETDSPFLNPSKDRNSPLNVLLIYEKIAEIKGFDKIEIENIIYRNYMKFIM